VVGEELAVVLEAVEGQALASLLVLLRAWLAKVAMEVEVVVALVVVVEVAEVAVEVVEVVAVRAVESSCPFPWALPSCRPSLEELLASEVAQQQLLCYNDSCNCKAALADIPSPLARMNQHPSATSPAAGNWLDHVATHSS